MSTSSAHERRRVHVDLDHAGVGGDDERAEPRVAAAAGSPRSTTGTPTAAAADSTTATRSTKSSSGVSGGRKTYRWPSRTSTHSAVGGASLDRPAAAGTSVEAACRDGRALDRRRAPAVAARARRSSARSSATAARGMPVDRVERQAQADRRVAGHQVELAAAERPRLVPHPPARCPGGAAAGPSRSARAAASTLGTARPAGSWPGCGSSDRRRAGGSPPACGPRRQRGQRILVGGEQEVVGQAEPVGEGRARASASADGGRAAANGIGEQVRVATTAARRRCASGGRAASGAAARPGTTCPGRGGAAPPGAKRVGQPAR